MISFTIPGAAHGKGRPRFARIGNHVSTYSPKETVSYENLVKLFASRAVRSARPIDCQCRMILTIYCAVPESWSRKKTAQALAGDIRPTTKPDLDNVLKTICDAINGIVWVDDKQLVSVTVDRWYADHASVGVCVIG